VSRDVLVLCAALAAAGAVHLLGPSRPAGRRPGRGPAGGWIDRLVRRARPAPPPPIPELLSALAAELLAGQPTGLALEAAAAGLDPPTCPRAIAACRTGADVAAALRVDAHAPGAQALPGLAACWEVSERSGAGLAVAVSRLAESLRAGAEAQGQLAGEVAAVRTSARLLAGLPLLGLLIGQWIGADPLVWLTGSWVGRGVLLVGVGLQVVGVAWLRHMVSATRDSL
jgi:tight adherence protein B